MDKQKEWERNMGGDKNYEWDKGKEEGVWDVDTKGTIFPGRLKPVHAMKCQPE
jgi:hypothetical protein